MSDLSIENSTVLNTLESPEKFNFGIYEITKKKKLEEGAERQKKNNRADEQKKSDGP